MSEAISEYIASDIMFLSPSDFITACLFVEHDTAEGRITASNRATAMILTNVLFISCDHSPRTGEGFPSLFVSYCIIQ